MLDMTNPIYNTGRQTIMDSGFSVAAGMVAMHKHGVYASALSKKRKYHPRYVPGDQIDEYFKDKELGYAETLAQDLEGVKFLVHCQKDTDYVTKIMSLMVSSIKFPIIAHTDMTMASGNPSSMQSLCPVITGQNTGWMISTKEGINLSL